MVNARREMETRAKVVGRDRPVDQLEFLLSEPPQAAVERERTAFDRAAAPFNERMVLFGAGGLGRMALKKLRLVGIQPLAFTDNNTALWGTKIDDIGVHAPAKAAELYGDSAVFVVTIWGAQASDRMSDRVRQLRNRGCMHVVPAGFLFWKFPEVFLPYFPLDLPHKVLSSKGDIVAAFNLFQDEFSRHEFVAQLSFRLLLDYDSLTCSGESKHYFPSELIDLRDDEVLVDCGAFDGDSIEEFVRRKAESFHSLIAFEPDPANWKKLHERLNRYPLHIRSKILTIPKAVGARTETVLFTCAGTDQSRTGQGTNSVQCVALDDALQGFQPSLIKFDIEGAELDTLFGGRNTISRCRPVLAVSAYHEQDHLWRIPLMLAEVCENYRFYLRPHGSEGWDLACYAVPDERTVLH